MTDYSKLNNLQLTQQIAQVRSKLKDDMPCCSGTEPLLHELQVHQIELEMQNRELREMQQQLEESRDRYADLYDFAPVGYLTLDENGRILEANLTAAALLGCERANLIGKSFVSWLAPGESAGFLNHLRQAFHYSANATAELKIGANGEMREVRLESAAIWKSAPPRICHTVVSDITEQKCIAGSLAQFRSEQEALLNTIPAAVYFMDMELRYIAMNQFCADLMRRPVAEMLGKTSFDLFPPEIAGEFQLSDRAVLQSGKAMTIMEQHIEDAQGNQYWVSISKAPFYGPDGKVAGLVGISMPITPLREAELRANELMQENRHLTRRMFALQEEERRHIARELHDDLGQWLTAIQAEAEAGAHHCATRKAACRHSARTIIDSAGQIHKVIRRILRRLRPSVLDQLGLEDSLREMVGQWRRHHPDINFELALDGDFEGLGELIDITLYRTIQEALTNISCHASANRVSIGLRREPDHILLTVEDNGKGMDTHLPRQGMGLLGMRERIIAAEGKLKLQSMPGQGMRIEATLPLTLLEDSK